MIMVIGNDDDHDHDDDDDDDDDTDGDDDDRAVTDSLVIIEVCHKRAVADRIYHIDLHSYTHI